MPGAACPKGTSCVCLLLLLYPYYWHGYLTYISHWLFLTAWSMSGLLSVFQPLNRFKGLHAIVRWAILPPTARLIATHALCTGPGELGPCTLTEGTLSYYEISRLVGGVTSWNSIKVQDVQQLSPYASYGAGNSSWVSFDTSGTTQTTYVSYLHDMGFDSEFLCHHDSLR